MRINENEGADILAKAYAPGHITGFSRFTIMKILIVRVLQGVGLSSMEALQQK